MKTEIKDFSSTFNSLKSILEEYENQLTVTIDKKNSCSLNAGYSKQFKREMFFGSVQIKKNYVSFYLMPVYVNPNLLKRISSQLKKRMQGKSCFNFKSIDNELLGELNQLTKAGFEFYKKNGML